MLTIIRVSIEVKAPIAHAIGLVPDDYGMAQFSWLVDGTETVGGIVDRIVALSEEAGKGGIPYVQRLRGDLADVTIALDGVFLGGKNRRERRLHDGAKITFVPMYMGG